MNEERISMLESILRRVADEGGNQERTRIFPNAEVIDSAPSGFSSSYIIVKDDKGFYTPAVKVAGLTVNNGDLVNLLFIKGTEPIAFQHGSGSSGASGGGYPFSIITVDPTDTDADYSDLASAISAASAGDIILFNGTHTITGSSLALNKAITLRGVDVETAIITSALTGDETVDVTAAASLQNCTVRNTASSGSVNRAIKTSASGIVLDNVVVETNGTSSSFALGVYCADGSDIRLTNVRASASGGGTADYALYIESSASTSVALVEQGRYEGTSGTDIRITGSSADVTLVDPHCATGGISIVNSATVSGSFRDAKGRDAGFVVVNSSGGVIAPGDVGYLDEAGEFQTTTTEADTVAWAVSNAHSDDGNLTFVKTKGSTTVNYTSTAPSQGDFLTTSTTAGDALARSTMHPAIFAVCAGAGIADQVEVLLLTGGTYVPYTSSNPYQQSPVLVSDSIWTGTINGAPSGATLVYTTSTGDENWLDATSANALAKLRLYNVTRGEYALISDTDVGTNTITLTDTVPGTWADTDSLTIASQTNTDTSGGASFLEYEITSEIPTLARAMVVDFHWTDTGANGQRAELHPYEAFAGAKAFFLNSNTNTILARTVILPLIQRRYTVRTNASGSGTCLVNVYSMGYILASP